MVFLTALRELLLSSPVCNSPKLVTLYEWVVGHIAVLLRNVVWRGTPAIGIIMNGRDGELWRRSSYNRNGCWYFAFHMGSENGLTPARTSHISQVHCRANTGQREQRT